MSLHQLTPAEGSRKSKKRLGRGQGSGIGGRSGKGNKGHQSRSGFKSKLGNEGGQMPLQRRVPKFGFTNRFRVEYQAVNLYTVQRAASAGRLTGAITPEALYEAGLIRKANEPVKVLGSGELSQGFEIHAHAFSQSALDKINTAGGKAVTL